MPKIIVYKVLLPSYYAYPSMNVILNVCYSRETAEEFIQNYPNPFLKPWLTISTETINVNDTD